MKLMPGIDIDQLKKIKGDPKYFLESKKEHGFCEYTFEELVRYLGYDNAYVQAKAYDWSVKYGYCRLVKNWRDVMSDDSGFKFLLKCVKGVDVFEKEFIVDPKGVMDDGVNFKDFCEQMESDGWIIKTRKLKKLIDGK